jgi:hypothetical protein
VIGYTTTGDTADTGNMHDGLVAHATSGVAALSAVACHVLVPPAEVGAATADQLAFSAS